MLPEKLPPSLGDPHNIDCSSYMHVYVYIYTYIQRKRVYIYIYMSIYTHIYIYTDIGTMHRFQVRVVRGYKIEVQEPVGFRDRECRVYC